MKQKPKASSSSPTHFKNSIAEWRSPEADSDYKHTNMNKELIEQASNCQQMSVNFKNQADEPQISREIQIHSCKRAPISLHKTPLDIDWKTKNLH